MLALCFLAQRPLHLFLEKDNFSFVPLSLVHGPLTLWFTFKADFNVEIIQGRVQSNAFGLLVVLTERVLILEIEELFQ